MPITSPKTHSEALLQSMEKSVLIPNGMRSARYFFTEGYSLNPELFNSIEAVTKASLERFADSRELIKTISERTIKIYDIGHAIITGRTLELPKLSAELKAAIENTTIPPRSSLENYNRAYDYFNEISLEYMKGKAPPAPSSPSKFDNFVDRLTNETRIMFETDNEIRDIERHIRSDPTHLYGSWRAFMDEGYKKNTLVFDYLHLAAEANFKILAIVDVEESRHIQELRLVFALGVKSMNMKTDFAGFWEAYKDATETRRMNAELNGGLPGLSRVIHEANITALDMLKNVGIEFDASSRRL